LDIARAGAFISIDGGGHLRVERGFVRPEDEAPVESDISTAVEPDPSRAIPARVETDGEAVSPNRAVPAESDEDDGLKPIPDRLMTELTAYRTLALRQGLGDQPDVAFLAALHALCIKVFYRYAVASCLELDLKSVGFGTQALGLNDTALAAGIERRHQAWIDALPKEPAELWDALIAFDRDSREALFAHCVSLSVNAVFDPYARRPRALVHADRLSDALDLDLVAAGWTPTVDNYLGRVTKARIVAAVSEACGDQTAQSIAHLKKGEMAESAQALLASSGWLPEALRTPRHAAPVLVTDEPRVTERPEALSVETAADGQETAMVETGSLTEDEPVVAALHVDAAE
jgi:ParB family transcriptional regulator, chromosome partitioning protein